MHLNGTQKPAGVASSGICGEGMVKESRCHSPWQLAHRRGVRPGLRASEKTGFRGFDRHHQIRRRGGYSWNAIYLSLYLDRRAAACPNPLLGRVFEPDASRS